MIKTLFRHYYLLGFVLLLIASPLRANNLVVEFVESDGREIHLFVQWENAWNLSTGPANHDAVWLFAKVKHDGRWEHVPIAPTSGINRTDPQGLVQIEVASDGSGAMLRTLAPVNGDIPGVDVFLELDQQYLDGIWEIAVFGVEMAWVNTGQFWLGDGASNFALHDSMTRQPYLIASENTIPLADLHADGANPPSGDIPAAYPKGHDGFYLMKYEVSQQQYADFLNLLTPEQAVVRAPSEHLYENRLGITPVAYAEDYPETPFVVDANVENPMNFPDDGQNRACNWLSWDDLAAYLDWAALRPITELEFEKACRGPLPPVPLEFAWGTDSIVDANTLAADGTEEEGVTDSATAHAGLASHGYAGPQGPLRCGFGAHASSNRLQAGAGYFGHMELSGNLWELCVSTQSAGLSYDGAWGDGALTDDGRADVATWPSTAGVGYKGGGWNSGVIPGFRDLAVSDRFYIGLASDVRRATAGGRGAR